MRRWALIVVIGLLPVSAAVLASCVGGTPQDPLPGTWWFPGAPALKVIAKTAAGDQVTSIGPMRGRVSTAMLVPQSAPDLWEVGHAVDYLSYEVSPTGRAALTEHHFRHGVQWLFHKISNSTTVPGIVGVVTFSGGGPGMPSPSPTLPGGFGPAGRGRPYPFVTVTVWAASGPLKGKLMASTVPNAQALFALDLLPGRYLVKAVPPAGGAIPTRSSRRAVIVRVGQRTCVILIVAGR